MKPPFRSLLSGPMEQFVQFKCQQGYAYDDQAGLLRRFDRFLSARGYPLSHLTTEIVTEYDGTLGSILPQTRRHVLSVVLQFCRFLHAVDPRSQVRFARPPPRHRAVCFYVFEQCQVVTLMEAARALRGPGSIRAEVMRVLIGLLYASGLRIGEALALELRDVDLAAGRLFVRRGKFAKERQVALTPDTVRALRAWLVFRARHAGEGTHDPWFIGRVDRRLTYCQVNRAFRNLVRQCGLLPATHPAQPRLHDLRHTYACHCLRRWRKAGFDIHVKLPLLATAMGHVSFLETQMYLHVTQAELEQAAGRFHRFVFPLTTQETLP